MKPEAQIKALAELDGYVEIELEHQRGSVYNPSGWMTGRIESSCCDDRVDVPNYRYSYDAIIPLIMKQDLRTKYHVAKAFKWDYRTTPAQFCEALLRETGKWVEE